MVDLPGKTPETGPTLCQKKNQHESPAPGKDERDYKMAPLCVVHVVQNRDPGGSGFYPFGI